MANATVWTEKTFEDNKTVIDAAFLNGFQRNVIAAEGVINGKVDKVTGKALSTNDFTTAHKNKLDALPTKATLDTSLAGKVDKVDGKGLSTNDYTDEDKQKVDVVDTKAPVILETVSGAIASFSDGADNMPIKSLVANIEPVQDLHGYDHPWPAGGGVNLFNEDGADWVEGYVILATGEITSNVGWKYTRAFLPVDANTEYTIQFNKADSTTVAAANHIVYYDSNQAFIERHELVAGSITGDLTATFTTPSNCAYYRLTMAKTGITNVQIEAGDAATDYAPYSNICPISGWTGAKIERTGKNVFDKTASFPISSGGRSFQKFIPYDRTVIMSLTDNDTSVSVSGMYFGFAFDPNNVNIGFTWVLSGGACSSAKTNVVASGTYAGQNMLYLTYFPNTQATLDAILQRYNIQIQYGSTATDYEPYTGNQISVTFPDEAGTVYGGTLDVVSGKMRVTWACYNASEFASYDKGSSTTRDEYFFRVNSSTQYAPVAETTVDIICSHARPGRTSGATYTQTRIASSQPRILFPAGKMPTLQDFSAWLTEQENAGTPLQFCYKLASPIEYQLTPQEVTTLLGTNHVWTDVGPVEVTYPADTKLFIENLTQPTEDDMTADHAISAGTFFQLGNTLYLATAAIAAGATITPGTNATKLSLADALNTLNS